MSGLIIVPGEQRLTLIRVCENQQITDEARRGLHLPSADDIYVLGQWGIVETPLGYIPVDHEAGHLRVVPLAEDEQIEVVIFSKATKQPLASNYVTVKHVLKHYTRQTMALADFVSNRDGMHVKWTQLTTSLLAAGVPLEQVEADRRKYADNTKQRIITGGSLPISLEKMKRGGGIS